MHSWSDRDGNPELYVIDADGLLPLTRYVAPCHCSGPEARETFAKKFGARYINIGAGRVIELCDLTD